MEGGLSRINVTAECVKEKQPGNSLGVVRQFQ